LDNKYKCKLFPYTIEESLNAQAATDRPGWNITSFDLPKVWKETKGEGVVVHVLDTGADLDHPDLVENILPGKNFIREGKEPRDDNKHGSHCAGIICAPKNGIGIIGVAPKCKVVPVKVLNKKGSGDMRVVAKAIRWSVDNGADIISMSLGCPNKVQQVRKAVKYAAKKGVPVFCAAGNAGLTDNIFYPARYPETIAVGSVDEDLGRSDFSNTGKNLDFMAPGGKILSTVPDNWYSVLSGTSMACPFVVGVAALLKSYVKNNETDLKLETVDEYRNALKKYTIPVSDKRYGGKRFFQGFGIVDPREFYEWIKNN